MKTTSEYAVRSYAILSLFLLVGLFGSASATRAETLELSLDLTYEGLEKVEDSSGVQFYWAGSSNLRESGRPALPATGLELLIPRDRQVRSVSLVGGQIHRLQEMGGLADWISEAPSSGPAPVESSFGEGPFQAFPPVTARLVADNYEHGFHVVGIEAYPLRQLADGSLELHADARLRVELEARPEPELADRQRRVPGWLDTVEARISVRLSNPEALNSYARPLEVEANVLFAANASGTPSLDSGPVQLLILTDAVMAPEFERLATHRERLGMATLVVTIDQVLANYRQGVDLTETLRLYIREAYERWGVDYVLLGGDSDIIPPRYAHSTFYPPLSFTDIPSDLYFAALDGNWNADGDALFGEHFISLSTPGDNVDFVPEVSVGRAPVSDLMGAQLFVDKILAYETPIDRDWLGRALFASEVLFPADWSEGLGIQLDGATYSEDIADTSLSCAPYGFESLRLYENHLGYAGGVEETKSAVIDSLSSGHYGLVNHVGHGFYFNMSVGDNNLVVGDMPTITNGSHYFALYSVNCSSGAFDFNCLLERFVQSPDGGAVAALGSARAAFPNKANQYQQAYYKALFCEGTPRVGDAFNRSREDGVANTLVNTSDRWTHFCYTLLGDPSMPIWTAAPRTAAVQKPASLPLGPGQATFTLTDTQTSFPIEGAIVTLSKNGEAWSGVTDVAGDVTVDTDVGELGGVNIWISGANILPQFDTIFTDIPPGPYLDVASLGVIDDSAANGNGLPETGEQFDIYPVISNSGVAIYGGGAAILSSSDPMITIIDSMATIPTIGINGSAPVSDAFTVMLDASAPDGYIGTIDFVLDAGGSPEFFANLNFSLLSSEIEILELRWDDSISGNDDGILQSGETVDVVFTLKNYGAGAVDGVTGSLDALGDPNIVLVDGAGAWGTMPAVLDTTNNAADTFQVSLTDAALAHRIRLNLLDSAGRMLQHDFDLDPPVAPTGLAQAPGGSGEIRIEWDPSTDTDHLGYRVYRRLAGIGNFELSSIDLLLGSSTFLDDNLAARTAFEFVVASVDSGGLTGPISAILPATTAPAEALCFPLPIGLETSSDLAVGHLDWDGVLDIVVGSELVYVIDGNCLEKKDGDNNSQTFGPISGLGGKYEPASIALGNFDGLPGLEIVACSWDTREVYLFDADGDVLPGWPVLLKNKNWGSPAVGDLDADGDLEIVLNDVGGYTYAFHHDGTEVADGDSDGATFGVITARRSGESFGRTSPALYDVDGDGQLEILFGTKYQNILTNEVFHAIKIDGTGLDAAGWGKVFAPRSEFLAAPTIADLNDDGTVEIIAHSENDSLYVWHPDGSRVAPFPLRMSNESLNSNSLAPSPAVGDFNGDGNLEMVIVETLSNTSSRIRVLDHLGVTLPGWPVTVGNLSEGSPVVGDITGDGLLDIVWGVGGGSDSLPSFLHAWNADGTVIDGFPILMGGFVRSSATLADIDGDGNVNILLASWDKLIHAWDMGEAYVDSLMPWPTFRGNVHRDGVLTTVVATDTPGGEGIPQISDVRLVNSPNPFNPRTTLSFELPVAESMRVQLVLFDAAGREVLTLVDGALPGGRHEFRWDGRDTQGRNVASGVYYGRLKIDGQTVDQRKLTLLK